MNFYEEIFKAQPFFEGHRIMISLYNTHQFLLMANRANWASLVPSISQLSKDDLYLRKIESPHKEVDRFCFFKHSAGFLVSDLIISRQNDRIIPLSHRARRVASSTAFTLQVSRKGKLNQGAYCILRCSFGERRFLRVVLCTHFMAFADKNIA